MGRHHFGIKFRRNSDPFQNVILSNHHENHALNVLFFPVDSISSLFAKNASNDQFERNWNNWKVTRNKLGMYYKGTKK